MKRIAYIGTWETTENLVRVYRVAYKDATEEIDLAKAEKAKSEPDWSNTPDWAYEAVNFNRYYVTSLEDIDGAPAVMQELLHQVLFTAPDSLITNAKIN